MKTSFRLILEAIHPRTVKNRISWITGFIRTEKKYFDRRVSPRDALLLWRNGFSSWNKYFYGLTQDNMSLYLPNMTCHSLHPINGGYSALLDNKAFLPLILDTVPNVNVVLELGVVRYRKGLPQGDLVAVLADYTRASGKELLCKPLKSSGGMGVRILRSETMMSEVEGFVREKASVLIQSIVTSHDYASQIFPGATNTIRFVFYRDVVSRKVRLANAAHRFGTSESIPTDNTGLGALLTRIDLETGVMGRSFVSYQHKYSGWHDVHPETGIPINNVQIPDWHSKLLDIIATFNSIQWFEYGGADVVFTNSGFVILEVNSLPSPGSQISRPFFSDPDGKAFFEEQKRLARLRKVKKRG